jgi:hypothetical protein
VIPEQSSTPALRCRVTFDEADGLCIVIPAKVNWVDVAVGGMFAAIGLGFAMIWLCVRMLAYWFHDPAGIAAAPLAPFLLMVLLGSFGLCLFVGRLWAVRCREVIHVDGYRITVGTEGYLFQPPIPWVLPLARIRNLRYSPVTNVLDRVGEPRETIAFDFENETIRFGRALSEDEARRLIRTVKDRYKIADDKEEPLPVERL